MENVPASLFATDSVAGDQFTGGFNRSVELFSVSRRGQLTLVARGRACTFAGDAPAGAVSIPDEGPWIVVVSHHGNGSRKSGRPTAEARRRLIASVKS